MIEAQFFLPGKYSSKEMLVSVSGHADFAESGNDIICAAFSILMNTLALSCEKVAGSVVTVEKNGGYRLFVEKVISPEKIDILMQGTITGVAILAEQYPDNVKIQVMQRKQHGS